MNAPAKAIAIESLSAAGMLLQTKSISSADISGTKHIKSPYSVVKSVYLTKAEPIAVGCIVSLISGSMPRIMSTKSFTLARLSRPLLRSHELLCPGVLAQ